MEPVVRETRDHAVVVHEAVFAQQHAVARTPDGEVGEVVDVQPGQELRCVGADHLDLAERRGIEHAAAGTDCEALARHRCMHVLARAREVAGALPQADVLEDGAMRQRPVVGGRGADRVEQVAAIVAGKTAERHRRVGHAERRQSDLWRGAVEALRHERQRVHARGLALVGRHAGRRVALDVLDRLEALPGREHQVAGRHVALEIDERLGRRFNARLGQRARSTAPAEIARDDTVTGRSACVSRVTGCGGTRLRAIGEHHLEPVHAAAGARRALAFGGCARHEGLDFSIPTELAA